MTMVTITSTITTPRRSTEGRDDIDMDSEVS